VLATDATGHVVGRADTGPDGRFSIVGLPFGQATVTAYVQNHRPRTVTASVTEHEAVMLDLVVETFGVMRGAVSGPAGQPLPNATVSLSDTTGTVIAATKSDENGRYELRGVQPGQYTVVTSLYEPGVVPVVLGSAPREDVDVDLVLRDPARLTLAGAQAAPRCVVEQPGTTEVPGCPPPRDAST
jgi:hypothetical protein